jgi:hypothetical protein
MHYNEAEEQMLICKTLPVNTAGEDIFSLIHYNVFNVFNNY